MSTCACRWSIVKVFGGRFDLGCFYRWWSFLRWQYLGRIFVYMQGVEGPWNSASGSPNPTTLGNGPTVQKGASELYGPLLDLIGVEGQRISDSTLLRL